MQILPRRMEKTSKLLLILENPTHSSPPLSSSVSSGAGSESHIPYDISYIRLRYHLVAFTSAYLLEHTPGSQCLLLHFCTHFISVEPSSCTGLVCILQTPHAGSAWRTMPCTTRSVGNSSDLPHQMCTHMSPSQRNLP